MRIQILKRIRENVYALEWTGNNSEDMLKFMGIEDEDGKTKTIVMDPDGNKTLYVENQRGILTAEIGDFVIKSYVEIKNPFGLKKTLDLISKEQYQQLFVVDGFVNK